MDDNSVYDGNGSRRSLFARVLIVVMLIVVVVLVVMFVRGGNGNDGDGEQSSAVASEIESLGHSMACYDSAAMAGEVAALRCDVNLLKQEVEKLKSNTLPSSRTCNSETPTPSQPKSQSSSSVDDIELVNYTQDGCSFSASMSLRNNTNKTVTAVSVRIVYTDMKGNDLDYYDYNNRIEIAPGMTKNVSIRAFGHSDHYYYYKSQSNCGSNRQYKIKYQLMSYRTK